MSTTPTRLNEDPLPAKSVEKIHRGISAIEASSPARMESPVYASQEILEHIGDVSSFIDPATITFVSKVKKKKQPFIIYNVAICATVGGALFGYNTGIINGANLLIKKEFALTDSYVERIVSSCIGAAAVFSLLAGVISDAIGRKTTIMISAVVFTIGGVLMGVANGPEMLLTGRITVGSAIGLVSSVVPVYVSECAPSEIRGCLITLNQLFITVGIWLSSIVAAVFQSKENGWRYMLGLASLPGILQFLFFLGLPESPRYQVMNNDIKRAERNLRRLRATPDVSEELEEIVSSMESEKDRKGWKVWKGIFTIGHIRYALFIGCMLQFFQQFSGINAVIYYSANILKSAGFDVRLAIWLSVIPFTVNFLATFIGLWAVEALGRTWALAASFISIAIALVVLMTAFLPVYLNPPVTNMTNEMGFKATSGCMDKSNCLLCIESKSPECAFCSIHKDFEHILDGSCVEAGKKQDKELYASEGRCSRKENSDEYRGGQEVSYAYGFCPSEYAWLAVLGLILFVLGFAPGAGPMPWTINAEIYPLWCRSVANSLAAVTNWGCNFLVSSLFLTVTKAITPWGTFIVFGNVCVAGALFVIFLVPETRKKSLEEIELLFMSKEEQQRYLQQKQTPIVTITEPPSDSPQNTPES